MISGMWPEARTRRKIFLYATVDARREVELDVEALVG
jgi:hypothetical protein